MVNKKVWEELTAELALTNTKLIAVSKTKPAADIRELYELGQKAFGENYVQELVDKHAQLPAGIEWHYIGHLQGNKVKLIAPFVHMVHAVDSFKLLSEINRQADKHNRVIDVLLQLHIADEETKFGMDEAELFSFLDYYNAQQDKLQHVRICGLMGMATNTANVAQLHAEFLRLRNLFTHLAETAFFNKPYFAHCSMGMSADYKIAVQEGSTMVRIGSMLFGDR